MHFVVLPHLSDLLVIALTIGGEGIGEPWVGKVLIADSIYNYAKEHHLTIRQSCLARRPNRYSCWDNPERLVCKLVKFQESPKAWADCVWLAGILNTKQYRPVQQGDALFQS